MRGLEKIRKSRGMTQGQLAETVGISREMVSYLECGRKSGSIETLCRIAGVLKCSTDELLGLDGPSVTDKEAG